MAENNAKRSDGYFMAKREMVEAIDRRMEILEEKFQKALIDRNPMGSYVAAAEKKTLEEVRDFVRNVMLWDTRND